MTWHEVQRRLLEVQKEQQMCIHKQELTELGLYRRVTELGENPIWFLLYRFIHYNLSGGTGGSLSLGKILFGFC